MPAPIEPNGFDWSMLAGNSAIVIPLALVFFKAHYDLVHKTVPQALRTLAKELRHSSDRNDRHFRRLAREIHALRLDLEPSLQQYAKPEAKRRRRIRRP